MDLSLLHLVQEWIYILVRRFLYSRTNDASRTFVIVYKTRNKVIVLNKPLMTVTFQPLGVGFAYVFFGLCTGLVRTPKCTVITCFLSFILSIWLVSFLSLQIYAERSRVS